MTTTQKTNAEWKDGIIVEFRVLSVYQRGVVLGDKIIGGDYDLGKDEFKDGVWKGGVDDDGSYNVTEYVEARLVEPDWVQEAVAEAVKRQEATRIALVKDEFFCMWYSCSNCNGTMITDESKFCPGCGSKIATTPNQKDHE